MATSNRAGLRAQRLRGEARARVAHEVLARWRTSEQGKAAFCRREGIAPVTLTRWLAEFGTSGGHARPPRFVEAIVGGPAPGGFEVVLPGGVRIQVPAGFDAGDLARIVGVLASC
jgi:hypothetical protein